MCEKVRILRSHIITFFSDGRTGIPYFSVKLTLILKTTAWDWISKDEKPSFWYEFELMLCLSTVKLLQMMLTCLHFSTGAPQFKRYQNSLAFFLFLFLSLYFCFHTLSLSLSPVLSFWMGRLLLVSLWCCVHIILLY